MPQFIQVVIALVTSFALSFSHGGKPATTPPQLSEVVSERGQEVSGVAKDLETPTSNQNSQPDSLPADTTKETTDNTKAEIQLPAPLPQVALDKSSSLEQAEGNLILPGPSSQQSPNPNADLGQEIAETLPDAAKDNGQSFGEQVSQAAQNNPHKP